MGFCISDFVGYPGFVESDLDDLVARGTITVTDTEAGDPEPTSRGRASRLVVSTQTRSGDHARLAQARFANYTRPWT